MVHHRGGLDLGPGATGQDVAVLAEEHRPGLVVAVVLASLPTGLVVRPGRRGVVDDVHLAAVARNYPGEDGGGRRRAMIDLCRGTPFLPVVRGVGQVDAMVVRPGGVHVPGLVHGNGGEVVAKPGGGAGCPVDDVVGEVQDGGSAGCGRHADGHVDGVEG